MFHFASAKETSLAPCKVLGKYSSNVCTHYEFFLIATAFAIHFPLAHAASHLHSLDRRGKKKGEKEKEKLQLIHKRANLLYMETTLSKAGPQEPETVSL